MKKGTGCAIAIFIIIVFSVTMCNIKCDNESSDKPDRIEAFLISQQFVENYLKAPGSVEWPSITDNKVRINNIDDNIWEVYSYVDSENSFGALIRTIYFCKIQYNKDKDNWTLLEIEFD
ncbi:MAG: hypothetical protein ACOC80_10500 [Petrotogales bacterium]